MRRSLNSAMAVTLFTGLFLFGVTITTVDAQTKHTRRRPATTTIIPSGSQLRIRLNETLSSKEARPGDRFTATVVNPSKYEQAKVSGHIRSIRKSGRVQGRTTMTLSFDSIHLSDGRSGPFRAEVLRIYDADSGEKVDDEGRVQSGSRGNQTLKRSGIGAAAGAVIGGIAGGGKGAAIGMVVGGAAGAGSIAVNGSKELRIERGTEMLVRANAR
jgi:hypothetical protein